MNRSVRGALRVAALLVVPVAAGVAAAPAAAAQDAPAAYQRSYELEARGDPRGALAALDRVPASGRDTYVYQLRRGWLLHLAGRHTDALAPYRRAVALAPGAVEPRLGLLLPLAALRRWREVVDVAAEVRRLDADHPTAGRHLAWALYNLGRYPEAERVYARLVALYPADAEMRAGVGWCQLRQGRAREAAATFEAVLAFAPAHPSSLEGARAADAAGR